jgi:hypothetical protein
MRAIRLGSRDASVVAGVALVAAGLAAGGAPALAGQAHEAAIVGDSVLIGVTCVSKTDCWAVGEAELNNVTRNQILHFNGRKWYRVPAPSPGGSTPLLDSSTLYSVGCTSGANCWAVGYYNRGTGSHTQALHWNGRKWSQVATPDPGGSAHGDNNDLFDVVCTSKDNCWAAGDDGHPIGGDDVQLNLVLHWNGKRWSQTRVPNPGRVGPGDVNDLMAIRCTAAASCWGVGTYGGLTGSTANLDNEVLRWNGKNWRTVSVPSPGMARNGSTESGLNAVSCTSARGCWAVGEASAPSGSGDEALHWNGSNWRTAPVPGPAIGAAASDALVGVSCVSSADCWTVGDSGIAGDLNAILHWNGHKWVATTVPQPAGTASGSQNGLSTVVCVSARNCWAVGYSEKPAEAVVNQILHWTGTKWAVAG